MNAPDPQPLVFALSDVLNTLQNIGPFTDLGYISATASWEQEDGRLRTLTLSVGAALDDEHEATDRPDGSRCGQPHPHYSALNCGRQPGHNDEHSYSLPPNTDRPDGSGDD